MWTIVIYKIYLCIIVIIHGEYTSYREYTINNMHKTENTHSTHIEYSRQRMHKIQDI